MHVTLKYSWKCVCYWYQAFSYEVYHWLKERFHSLVQQEWFLVTRLHIIQHNFMQNWCFPTAQFQCFPSNLSECVFIVLNYNNPAMTQCIIIIVNQCMHSRCQLYRTEEGWYIVCFLQMFNCIYCPRLGNLSNYMKGHTKNNVHVIYCGIWSVRKKLYVVYWKVTSSTEGSGRASSNPYG